MNQFGREHRQSIVMAFRPAIFDSHVLALDIAFLFQPLAECAQADCLQGSRYTAEDAQHGYSGLLRVRRERCSDRRTSNHFDEIAPSHATLPGPSGPSQAWAERYHPGDAL